MTGADGTGLAGRRVLITGASSGIGAAAARAIAAAGGRVALLARRADALAALADELGGVAVPADVTDHRAAAAAVDAAARQLGGLDALVNAAGVLYAGLVADTDPARWREMFEVNVIGLLAVTKAAIPHLREGSASCVLNVSSMSGRRVPNAAGGVYSASKFAVHAIGDALRLELGSAGVRVSTLAPGFVRTDILGGLPDGPLRERYTERMAAEGMDPEVIALAIVYLLGLPADQTIVEYAVTSTAK